MKSTFNLPARLFSLLLLRKQRLTILIAAVCWASSRGDAASIQRPAGLSPGDAYRVAFVTNGFINPRSSNIETYNNFVAAQAALLNSLSVGLNTNWSAIASTEGVSARINTETDPTPPGIDGVPIYLVDGVTRVADSYDDLWDGTINAPINLTQFGAATFDNGVEARVWTGTRENGTSYIGFLPFTLEAESVVAGFSVRSSGYWIDEALIGRYSEFNGRLYALSDVLIAIPEPSTLMLALAGIGLLPLRRR